MMGVLAAKRLLDRKGVSCSVFIGIKYAKSNMRASETFEAHSWLVHGECVVAGDGDIGSFKVLQRFD